MKSASAICRLLCVCLLSTVCVRAQTDDAPPPAVDLPPPPPPPPNPPPPLAKDKPKPEPADNSTDPATNAGAAGDTKQAANETSDFIPFEESAAPSLPAEDGVIPTEPPTSDFIPFEESAAPSLPAEDGVIPPEPPMNVTFMETPGAPDMPKGKPHDVPSNASDTAGDVISDLFPPVETGFSETLFNATDQSQDSSTSAQSTESTETTTEMPPNTTAATWATESSTPDATTVEATTSPDTTTASQTTAADSKAQPPPGIKVDLPPPPPIIVEKPGKPEMVFKKEPGITTIEIKASPFDKLFGHLTDTQVTTSGTIQAFATTATVTGSTPSDQLVADDTLINTTDSTMSTAPTSNVSSPTTYGFNDTSTSSYATSTEPTVHVDETKHISKGKIPFGHVPAQALDNKAPDLPPPIFVPETPLPNANQVIKNTADIPTDNLSGIKRTVRPPPPPIIFTESPSFWNNQADKTTARSPTMPENNQMKQIPPELDPKFMSVSDLAFYTLQQMKRQKQIREAAAGKGMGVQVFFNTMQPLEVTTPVTKADTKGQNSIPINQQAGNDPMLPTGWINDNIASSIQTTIPPVETVKPLEPPPSKPKTFFSADELLSQLGLSQTNQPVVPPAVPSNAPRGLFKPFLPTLNNVRPSVQNREPLNQISNREPLSSNALPSSSSQTKQSPAQNRPFYDSNYLLKQLGMFSTPKPPTTTQQQIVRQNNQIPSFIGANFAAMPQQATWQNQFKPSVFGHMQNEENQVVKFQRRGQVHTRPIDLRTRPKSQPFIDYKVDARPTEPTPTESNIPSGGTKSVDVQQNIDSGTIPFSGLMQLSPTFGSMQQDRAIRYIYGNSPITKDTPLWQKTHTGETNVATRLRNTFNRRIEQTHEPEPILDIPNVPAVTTPVHTNNFRRDLQITSNAFDTVKPSPDSVFNFNSNLPNMDNIKFGGQRQQPSQLLDRFGNVIPRTGSEVRRDFNRHIQNEFTHATAKPDPSWNQPSFFNTGNIPQFPLASQRGVKAQVSPLRTAALITDFFKPSNYKTSIKTLEENVKAIPSLAAKPDHLRQGYQTHWSAPLSNTLTNKVANVPYQHIRRQERVVLITTEAPLNIVLTTTPTRIITTASPITTQSPTTTTTTTSATTTTTEAPSTRPVTRLPTAPPTADPNPPPIFDSKVQQTFMPFPVMGGDTTNPTISGGDKVGWGDNNTNPNVDGRCSKCVFVNDRCLLPDPQHCNIYIECVRQGHQVRAFVRSCALGAFFDRKSFLCVDPKIADCPTDRCRTTGVKWYPIEGHCKHYWSCGVREGGAAFAQSECCPDMGGFKDGEGCVENPNCTESCDSAVNTETPTGCKLRKTPSPTVYYDENAKLERPCAPGTLFNELQCTCVQDVTYERSENRTGGGNCNCTNETTCACREAARAPTGEAYCAPFLAISFDGKKITDSSNMRQNIGVEGVSSTALGEGIFNGGGKLVLWRYANLMVPIVFAMRLKFLATSAEPRYQTLVANCDKNGAIEPTLSISIDTTYSEVVFNVNTYDGPAKRFKIMYEPATWSSVDVIYDGERIVGSVNGRSRNIISGGGIETRPFPIAVGGCSVNKGFKGLMKDVYIYEQCIPDDMYGIFMSVLE